MVIDTTHYSTRVNLAVTRKTAYNQGTMPTTEATLTQIEDYLKDAETAYSEFPTDTQSELQDLRQEQLSIQEWLDSLKPKN